MKTFSIAWFISLLPLFCIQHMGHTQPEDIISRHYTMKDGLSHEYIFCILQDSQGFLWGGTQGGLNKFDGYHFTTYRENPSDSNNLSNNYINCLWEDQQQRLWIGTITGLDLFDLKTEKFHHLLPDSLEPSQGSDIAVQKIREQKDGKVWICTSQGVYLADPQTLSMKRVIYFPQEVGGNSFRDIAEAQDGSLWAASGEGLVHMDMHTGQTTRYLYDPEDPHSLADDVVWTVYVDRHDRVWIGTGRGLDLFNPIDQSFTHSLPERLQSDKSPSPIFQVFTWLEHPDGTFWIGSNHGLYAFDPETGKFNNLLVNKYIWSLLKDRRGSIWLGSGYGLYQIAPQSKKFNIYRQFGQTDVSFILSLAEGADHQIWISSGSGLFRFDPFSKRFFQYLHDPENPHSFSGNSINGIIPDHEGGVWLASNGKLDKFNPHYQTFSSIALPITPANKLPAMLLDSKGKIWIGEWGGVGMYDPPTETYERLAAFPNVRVHSFLEDREENIWIGTINGLFRYSLKTGQLDVFKHDPADPQSLSNNRIYHLMMDQEGTLWIGTAGGLNQMIFGTGKEEPKFTHWQATNSDLPHDDVYCIIDGGDGTLWMGCGNRISHFFPQTGIFRNYDDHDGLSGQSIGSFGRGLRSHNGEIYFGSIDGLVVFHPDSLQENPYTPPVAITGFSIHNEPVPVQGSYGDTLTLETPLTHTIPYTNEVELTYHQNDFSLEFAALNFINPENNHYKYKLEPYETTWIETSATNRIARYTNISPGRYTFRVIGSNNDGVWNEQGASLQVIILPPFWQTWWAYCLYGMLFIGLLYGLRQYTVNRERLKNDLKLQRIESEKMHEIDHLKSRFFANISHEFRTPLTLILGPVQSMLMHVVDAEQVRKNHQMIYVNGKRLLHLINQLLDLSKLEAGSMKLEPKPADIVSFLKATVLSFTSLAEGRQIQYHVQYPVEHPVVYFDADKLEKIIINLLSNAFKFTPAGGKITVTARMNPAEERSIPVSFSKADSSRVKLLELKIQDSGTGIAEHQQEKIFDRFYQTDTSHTREQQGTGIGLSLVKELVDLHQGEVSVESSPGKGSCFTVRLPLLMADYEQITVGEPALQNGQSSITSTSATVDEMSEPSQSVIEGVDTEAPLVLIVEDNADIRQFIRQHLHPYYQVVEAADGAEGYSKAVETIPDLILSDVMMPVMDGVELCRKLKQDEKTAHVPVILLTAKASGADKIEGLETGADDYIIKPFEASELLVRIKNLIESRKKLREHFSREITLEPASIAITSVDEQFLQRVMQIIEEHIDDASFGVEAFGLEVGMSRMQLFRKLKALTNHSPVDFIRVMRLKRAAELLSQGAGNIAEVALLVGFQNPSYFTKCFQKQFGQTPSEFLAARSV